MGNGVAVGEVPGTARPAWRRRPLALLGLAAAILSAAALALGGVRGFPWLQGGETLEVSLVARDLKFNGTNPRIEIRRGDTLRLVLKNAEPAGIAHDLVIAGPGGLTSKRLGPGETEVISFTPSQAGVYHYSCSLHPRLMDGEIVVQP